MITMILFSAFMGASSTVLITIPENPVHATTNQTALLSISLHFSTPLGQFFHIKWDFLSGKRPILVYMLRKCKGHAHTWWQSSCQRSVEVAEEYQQRVNISLENASLVIQQVQPQDAGTYQITVQGLDVLVMAELNLTVGKAAPPMNLGRVNTHSMVTSAIRLGIASLVLCLLGLIVGEAVYKQAGCSLPSQRAKTQTGEPELNC